MGLVGKDQVVRDVPHEEGQSFTFRLLSGPELDEAQEVEQQRQMGMLKHISPEVVQQIIQRGGQTAILTDDQRAALRERGVDADVVEEVVKREERAAQFDKDTLVLYGLSAWSYDEDCDDTNKRRLDARTRDWAATEIVKMNTRSVGEGIASDVTSPLAEYQQD